MGFKGWKKTAHEKDHAIMRNKDGHELKIALKGLSPKLRGQLAEIELHKEETPQKMSEGGRAWNQGEKEDFSRGASKSGSISAEEKSPETHEAKRSDVAYSHPGEDKVGNAIAATQQSNQADPSKASALEKTNKARAKFYGMADGGPVEGEVGINLAPTAPINLPDQLAVPGALPEAPAAAPEPLFGTTPETASSGVPPGVMVPSPAPSTPPQAAPIEAPSPPVGMSATPPATPPVGASQALTNGLLGQGVNEQKRGVMQEAAALGAQGKEEVGIHKAAMEAQDKALSGVQEKEKTIMTEVDAIRKDIAAGHIDPNHYMSSMSTGKRIMTTIGLILGGMSGGYNGRGGNPALDALNHAIDNDIEGQKAELGKKQSLLSALNTQFDNVHASAQLAKGIMLDHTSSQLKMAAAKAMDPIAKARALQAAGEIDQKNAAMLKPIATQIHVGQLKKYAEANPDKALDALSQMAAIDPKSAKDLQERYIPGMGFATSSEGAVKVKDMKGMVDGAKSGIKELLTINKIPGKSFSPETKAKAEAISQSLVGMLRVPITGPGAMNEGERKMLERLVANPTNIFSLDNNTKTRLETLSKRLDQSLNSMAAANGIKNDPVARLNPQQKSFYDFAQKNPNDPRSKMIMEKLGLN